MDDKEGWRNIQGCLEQGCLEQGCAEVAEAGSGAVRQQSAVLLVQFQMQHQLVCPLPNLSSGGGEGHFPL